MHGEPVKVVHKPESVQDVVDDRSKCKDTICLVDPWFLVNCTTLYDVCLPFSTQTETQEI